MGQHKPALDKRIIANLSYYSFVRRIFGPTFVNGAHALRHSQDMNKNGPISALKYQSKPSDVHGFDVSNLQSSLE